MRGVFSSLVAVFLLSLSRTDANEQPNTSTSQCKACLTCGMPGMPGIPGTPGAPGSPGRDGFKGEKGTGTGSIGPRGPVGPKGEKGNNGTMGPKGSAGIPGNSGPRGLNGPEGKKGERGELGLIGVKGSTGAPGNSGSRGAKGSKGQKGNMANIDPRQLANWNQCVWKSYSTTDSGKIKECSFNKLHSNTALKVSYQGNVRVYNGGCGRWYFKFNGNECSAPTTIESILYCSSFSGSSCSSHIPNSFEGYCENLARGTVRVELWVGACSGDSLRDNDTGYKSVSRIIIEEVPPSQ